MGYLRRALEVVGLQRLRCLIYERTDVEFFCFKLFDTALGLLQCPLPFSSPMKFMKPFVFPIAEILVLYD